MKTNEFRVFEGDLYTQDEYSKPIRKDYAKTFRTIETPAQLASTLRNGQFAWPGGYQMALITSDGGLLCFNCAKAEFANCADSLRNQTNDGWQIRATTVLYETLDGPEVCDHCNKVLLDQDD